MLLVVVVMATSVPLFRRIYLNLKVLIDKTRQTYFEKNWGKNIVKWLHYQAFIQPLSLIPNHNLKDLKEVWPGSNLHHLQYVELKFRRQFLSTPLYALLNPFQIKVLDTWKKYNFGLEIQNGKNYTSLFFLRNIKIQ